MGTGSRNFIGSTDFPSERSGTHLKKNPTRCMFFWLSGRNPPSYCTLILIAMQGHQQKGRQNNTSSNNKDKSNPIIETSTAEDHDDENLHNPSTRPRYSPGSRFWTSSSLDVPAGVTQEEGHTGFLIHLLSAVRASMFLARRIQPFLSLVDCESNFVY